MASLNGQITYYSSPGHFRQKPFKQKVFFDPLSTVSTHKMLYFLLSFSFYSLTKFKISDSSLNFPSKNLLSGRFIKSNFGIFGNQIHFCNPWEILRPVYKKAKLVNPTGLGDKLPCKVFYWKFFPHFQRLKNLRSCIFSISEEKFCNQTVPQKMHPKSKSLKTSLLEILPKTSIC